MKEQITKKDSMTPRFFGGVCWRWWLSPCYAVIFLTDVMSPLKTDA